MYQKLLIFILMLCCIGSVVQAQDRIITSQHDTISCKIIRIGASKVHFRIDHGTVSSRGSIPLSEVKTLVIDSGANADTMGDPGMPPSAAQELPAFQSLAMQSAGISQKLRIGFAGGPSYLSGSTTEAKQKMKSLGMKDSEVDSYFSQYRLGWQANASAHYFFLPGLAPGIQYRLFNTGASLFATFDPQDNVNIIHDYIEENMYAHYAGISLLASSGFRNSEKWFLTSSLSAGMAFYRDEASMLSMNLLSTGKAFGATLDVGVEYFFTRNISFYAGLNLFMSTIGKMTVDTGYGKTEVKLPKDERENMSAYDLSGGIRFYF
jgi:hypothetical protein